MRLTVRLRQLLSSGVDLLPLGLVISLVNVRDEMVVVIETRKQDCRGMQRDGVLEDTERCRGGTCMS